MTGQRYTCKILGNWLPDRSGAFLWHFSPAISSAVALRSALLLLSSKKTSHCFSCESNTDSRLQTRDFGAKSRNLHSFWKADILHGCRQSRSTFFWEVQTDLAHLLSGLCIPSPRAFCWLLIHNLSKNHSIKTGLATLLGKVGRRPCTVLLGTVLSHHLLPVHCLASLPVLSEVPGDEKRGCPEAQSKVGLQWATDP